MINYTLQDLRDRDLIIFEAIMGSYAYGTNLPTSDKDTRGVFIQPLEDILEHGFVNQVADDTNDIVYYELGRFLELIRVSNPGALEMLYAPLNVILISKELWRKLLGWPFLTKRCRYTFGGYAVDQIKKAKGYNKKINWEESQMTRKGVLDFCYILKEGDTISLYQWLKDFNENYVDIYTQKDFGLAKINHARDLYAVYKLPNSGIVGDLLKSNDVQLTSIPKGIPVIAYLTFNKDAYSIHCRRYKEYLTWLKKRNEDRFKMNKEHGKNYDSKNMMHTYRLLNVALEIAKEDTLRVRRPLEEIEILMKIRRGEYEYDDLVKEAEEKIKQLDEAYNKCDLPEKVDQKLLTNLLLKIRKERYEIQKSTEQMPSNNR